MKMKQTMETPSAYICPITSEIMKEPVLNKISGHTYEKDSITTWLEKNNTDPITREKSTIQDLVPNRALKEAIVNFQDEEQKTENQEVESDIDSTPSAYTCPLSME